MNEPTTPALAPHARVSARIGGSGLPIPRHRVARGSPVLRSLDDLRTGARATLARSCSGGLRHRGIEGAQETPGTGRGFAVAVTNGDAKDTRYEAGGCLDAGNERDARDTRIRPPPTLDRRPALFFAAPRARRAAPARPRPSGLARPPLRGGARCARGPSGLTARRAPRLCLLASLLPSYPSRQNIKTKFSKKPNRPGQKPVEMITSSRVSMTKSGML